MSSTKIFPKRKHLTSSRLQEFIAAIGSIQIRPDLNGNIRFALGYGPYDERDFWLSGKPVGGNVLRLPCR